MGMTAECWRRFEITVKDAHTGSANTHQTQTFTIEALDIQAGGLEFGFATDKCAGVRIDQVPITCANRKHAFSTFNKMAATMISAITRTAGEPNA